MNLEEKLNLFYETTINDASKESTSILDEYSEKLQESYEEHKKETLARAELILRSEKAEIAHEKNKKLSSTIKEIKRQVNAVVDQHKEIVFQDVKVKITDFMQTEEYIALLEKQIMEAIAFAKGEKIIIYINVSDEKHKTRLEQRTGVALVLSERDFFGGTRAVIQSKQILIDNSFITKLIEEENVYAD